MSAVVESVLDGERDYPSGHICVFLCLCVCVCVFIGETIVREKGRNKEREKTRGVFSSLTVAWFCA